MRNLMLLAMLATPLAQAESLEVAANSMLRLPDKSASVHLTHLRVADSATLLLPASLAELKVDQLELGRDARIAIAPSDSPLLIEARSARLGEGSEFSAPGAARQRLQPLKGLRACACGWKFSDASSAGSGWL